MAKVNTVLGSISSDDLGITLVHEHLVVGYGSWQCDTVAAPSDREEIALRCARHVELGKPYGVKSIVDVTTGDVGRDVELSKRVSELTGVHVIASTGMFLESMSGACAYWQGRARRGIDIGTEIYEVFVKEITEGIGKTGVKAGAIKVLTGAGQITAYQEMVIRAAARAQKETGVPIITHTQGATLAVEQADLLLAAGADPRKVMVGHMCMSTNLAYHMSVLERGVSIGFDQLGYVPDFGPLYAPFPSDRLRMACLTGLLNAGFASRIMLSTDTIPLYLGRDMEVPAEGNYARLFTRFIPCLKEAGVTDGTIRTMMQDNPRRLFGGE